MVAELLERAKVLTLTTTGRVSGQPHPVTLWFVYHAKAGAIFLLSYPGKEEQGTDWYRNALAHPDVSLSVRGETLKGTAVPSPESAVEKAATRIRDMLSEKYGRAMVSYWYGDEPRFPLKIEIADAVDE